MASYVTHKILHILLNECTYMIIHVHYIHDIHLYTVYNNIHYKDIIHHWIWKIPTFHVQALEVALSVWVAWKVKLPSWQIASSRCRSGSNRSCARPINCPRCHLLELKAHKQIEKNLGEWWMVNGAFVPLNVVCQFSALKRNKRKLFQFTQTPNTMLSRWCVCIDSLRFCIYFVVRPRCGLSTMESSVQGSKTERWNEVTKHLKHWKICTFFFKISESTALSFCFPGPFWWYAGRSWFCEGTLWYRMFGPCGTLRGSHGGWNERRRHLDRGSARHLGMPRWCQGDLRWRWRQQDALWPSGQRTQCGRFLPFFGSTLWRRACQFASWNYLEHSPSLSCHEDMSWSCLDEHWIYWMFHWHLLDFAFFQSLPLRSLSSSNSECFRFKISDCVVVPSRYEPFGLTICEAWAAGKVVVVSW